MENCMILIRAPVAIAMLALTALVCPLSRAQDAGFYLGGNGGLSVAKIDDQKITTDLLNGGLATSSISNRQNDVGFKFYGGYQFSRFFALEGGYFNLGKFDFTATTVPAGTL